MDLGTNDTISIIIGFHMAHMHNEKPVGYVSDDREWIYIGHGEWIPYKSYCNIKFGAKQPSQFVKQMAVAVYGVDTLIKSTISGKGSNRNKQQLQPQETLNPIKLLAIKDIYRFYLITVLGKAPEQADVLVEKARHHISHKIAGLKSKLDKKNTAKSQSHMVQLPAPVQKYSEGLYSNYRPPEATSTHQQQSMDIKQIFTKSEFSYDKRDSEDDDQCIYVHDDA